MFRASAAVRWVAVLNYIVFVFFWIVLAITKTSISSILALLASLVLVLLATITLFKLLLKRHLTLLVFMKPRYDTVTCE